MTPCLLKVSGQNWTISSRFLLDSRKIMIMWVFLQEEILSEDTLIFDLLDWHRVKEVKLQFSLPAEVGENLRSLSDVRTTADLGLVNCWQFYQSHTLPINADLFQNEKDISWSACEPGSLVNSLSKVKTRWPFPITQTNFAGISVPSREKGLNYSQGEWSLAVQFI